jgi:hypothetical protein
MEMHFFFFFLFIIFLLKRFLFLRSHFNITGIHVEQKEKVSTPSAKKGRAVAYRSKKETFVSASFECTPSLIQNYFFKTSINRFYKVSMQIGFVN